MLPAGGHDIDTGRLDGAMAQQVGQLGNVLGHAVKQAGKQVAQGMWMDLFRIDVGILTKALHPLPDPAAVQGTALPGDKDGTGADPPGPGKIQQIPAQLVAQRDIPGLALEADHRHPGLGGLHREEAHLAHPYPGTGHGPQQDHSLLIPVLPGLFHKGAELLLAQLVLAEDPALTAQALQLQMRCAHKFQEGIYRRDHAVHRPYGPQLRHLLLPVQQAVPVHQLVPGQKFPQLTQAAAVLVHRSEAALPAQQVLAEQIDIHLVQINLVAHSAPLCKIFYRIFSDSTIMADTAGERTFVNVFQVESCLIPCFPHKTGPFPPPSGDLLFLCACAILAASKQGRKTSSVTDLFGKKKSGLPSGMRIGRFLLCLFVRIKLALEIEFVPKSIGDAGICRGLCAPEEALGPPTVATVKPARGRDGLMRCQAN